MSANACGENGNKLTNYLNVIGDDGQTQVIGGTIIIKNCNSVTILLAKNYSTIKEACEFILDYLFNTCP